MNITQELEQRISDPDFKKALFADPKATLANMGVDLPEEMKLKVLELSRSEVDTFKPEAGFEYLILKLPSESNDELSDQELDSVVGGVDPFGIIFGALFVASVGVGFYLGSQY